MKTPSLWMFIYLLKKKQMNVKIKKHKTRSRSARSRHQRREEKRFLPYCLFEELQTEPSGGFLRKRRCENIQQIYTQENPHAEV